MVGQLSTVSEEFRTRWAAHDVRIHHNGAKQFHHPVVGTVDLTCCTLELPAEDRSDLRLTIYTAEPGSRRRTRSSCWPAGRRPRSRQPPRRRTAREVPGCP